MRWEDEIGQHKAASVDGGHEPRHFVCKNITLPPQLTAEHNTG
jgi:hypothetical protein